MHSNHFPNLKCHRCSGHSTQPCSTVQNHCHALGSFFNDFFGSNVLVTAVGQKVVFATTGPLLNVAPAPPPNSTTDLQVDTCGVYEISMHLEAILSHTGPTSPFTRVLFALFINDTTQVPGSIFGSYNDINATGTATIANSIGNTVLQRLNPNDRLSIKVITLDNASGAVQYVLPSLVVTKIAE